MIVPPSTRIRRNRVHNIDDKRLAERAAYLKDNKAAIAYACNSTTEVRARAQEIAAIRDELLKRADH